MADDELDGMLIPTGTVLIPNTWCAFILNRSGVISYSHRQCLHDKDAYPDPMAFIPDRFVDVDKGCINHNIRDPREYVFGYGRR
jgi:hypothetical protein